MELRCLYSNVDQLLNKIDDVKALIANDNPDIMLFTEVIPKALLMLTLDPPEYEVLQSMLKTP